MKRIVFFTLLLLISSFNELKSQTDLKESKIGIEQSDKITELKKYIKNNLNSRLYWETEQAGFIKYNDNKRYIKGNETDITVITLRSVSKVETSFLTCLKHKNTTIQESGKLYFFKGVYSDIIVIINYSYSKKEKLKISVFNHKLEKLCYYIEKGEELSQQGKDIYKSIFEDPSKVIRKISSNKCKIQSESVYLQTKKEFDQEAEFAKFQNLFEDISMYLGDMQSYIFPFDYPEYKKKIEDAKPIPEKYKQYINVKSSKLDFCRGHLNELRDFYPLYKIKNGENICLIMYYSVPEIPRNRVSGQYYFLFSYTNSGKYIDVYPLAFDGTDQSHNGYNRYSELWSLQDIKTVSASRSSFNDILKEFICYSKIDKNGKAISETKKLHYEILPKRWIYVYEENDQQYVIEDCGKFSPVLEFIIDESADLKVSYFTGQEATIYDVEEFKSDPHERVFRMIIVDQMNNRIRFHIKFYYDDQENMTIRLKGFSKKNSDRIDLFAQESILYPGSHIKVKKVPCEEH